MQLLAVVILASWLANTSVAEIRPEQPDLIGVWYGDFISKESGTVTEVWLEITSQQPVNGYDVHGFNRWHTMDTVEALPLGPESLGFGAEHFDTFSGNFSGNRQSMNWVEDHTKARVIATVDGPDKLTVHVVLAEEDPHRIQFELERVVTGYAPEDEVLMGVDVSHHSGDVDWAGVRELGYAFAYVKASEGVDLMDPRFKEHWQALRVLDFPHGAYHFYVTEDDPVQQARFFASHLREHPGSLRPVVDVEILGHNTTGDMTETLIRFLQVFEAETGIRPMIYTAPNFWDRYFRPEFAGYKLWMSEFEVDQPRVPFGWQSWTLWQRRVDEAMTPVEKSVDISVLHPSHSLQDLLFTTAQE
ncbi:MAG TPA: GH25 family lysozyme [Xanthomonadales bacterium]|nr:GH25 family lysozyme [Xanthomonadales bacterium]